jgi:formyltetrahydrofolate-dependent phosphoribosylglycinamide formyltransferase
VIRIVANSINLIINCLHNLQLITYNLLLGCTRHSGLTTYYLQLITYYFWRMIQVAIFASGAGTNAQQIIQHFNAHPHIKIALIVCNKSGAGVIDIAAKENIPVLLVEKEKFLLGNAYTDELKAFGIDFIVLAGFLWKLPAKLVAAFSGKIINIHPALLPGYGGKGMYGAYVHEAVITAGEKESGITIHFVDEWYDHGKIIFQATCTVDENETPASLAQKIHELEHTHYPTVIEKTVQTVKS